MLSLSPGGCERTFFGAVGAFFFAAGGFFAAAALARSSLWVTAASSLLIWFMHSKHGQSST